MPGYQDYWDFEFAQNASVLNFSGTGSEFENVFNGGIRFTISVSDGDGDNRALAFFNTTLNTTDPASYLYIKNDVGAGDVFEIVPRSTFASDAPVQAFSGTTAQPIILSGFAPAGTFKLTLVATAGSSQNFTTTLGTDIVAAWNITTTGVFSSVRFTSSTENSELFLEQFTAIMNPVCFGEGTRIATPDGEVAVEALSAGDSVRLADGRAVPVCWVGRMRVDPSVCGAERMAPVRIAAGALGPSLPVRDLVLSPDHAVALDGCLVTAGALVNGTTIRREIRTEPFTYYHVETEAHELLLAEGVAVESYLEHVGPAALDGAARLSRVVREMDLPRITSHRLLPAHLRGPITSAQAAA